MTFANPILANDIFDQSILCVWCVCGVQDFRGCVQDLGAPSDPSSRDSPSPQTPLRGPPKISLFFFPLPPQFSFISPSLLVFFVEFWWCLKRRDPQMCTFGVLRLSCETPAARSGQHKLAKNGLAKNDIGQNWPAKHDGQKWIGQNWIGQSRP